MRPQVRHREGPLSQSIDHIERSVAAVTDVADRGQVAGAVTSVSAEMIVDVLHGGGDAGQGELVASGIGASPGVAGGVVRTTVDGALDAFDRGEEVVLAMAGTSPADEIAMRIAVAVVTESGGLASHAAVVARDLGVAAVVGTGPTPLRDGDEVWVDGATGEVRRPGQASAAAAPILDELPDSLAQLLGWADDLATVRVLANADRTDSAALARRFGARGIGLCRIEHMFLGDRAEIVAAALGDDPVANEEIAKVLTDDLVGVFGEMSGLPVTVRLLDAPLHEFGGPHEHNPMMGLRGVRLGVVNEPLLRAQARAIGAAARAAATAGHAPAARIMVPLVSLPAELELVAGWVRDEVGPDIPVGVMVETPRAALCADRLAATAEFISFGTNDLTQFTYGWSRDDLEQRILDPYRRSGLLDVSPFETLDEGGVARLMALATETARAARPGIPISMCGEHGGDPRSVAVAARMGVDAVSASPYRVPVARLAAGHAAIAGAR